MMNGQCLAKNALAFILGYSAILALEPIPLNRLSSLGLPVRSVPVDALAVNEAWVTLSVSVFVATLSGTVLTASLVGKFRARPTKNRPAVKALKFFVVLFRLSFYRGVLASGRAVFTSTVLYPARNNVKLLFTVLADSSNFNFHFYPKTKPLRGPGAVVEAVTSKALEGVNKIIAGLYKTKKRPTGIHCLDTDIIAQGF